MIGVVLTLLNIHQIEVSPLSRLKGVGELWAKVQKLHFGIYGKNLYIHNSANLIYGKNLYVCMMIYRKNPYIPA
ncbi:hypothetical protein YA22_03010 [Klebsiella aerogenes]|nr:hypothetical protein YA22_03010 [Klebsiella aerogenes]